VIWLRLYLLAGLILHKAVWERLKRTPERGPAASLRGAVPFRVRAVKLGKIALLALILVQTVVAGYWFPIASSPAALQVVGVCLYTIGLAVAIIGRVQLGGNWSDIEAAQVLSRQAVVRHGIYRYIRHPIYVGDLLLLTGLELALNSWVVLGVLGLTPIVLWRAIQEEALLKNALDGYREYCKSSKRFIPFVV
jgi:protein-S-isoprenylcysteine O-methyltransferase Ste14